MSSRAGVMLLYKIAGGMGFWDNMSKRIITAEKIRRRHQTLKEKWEAKRRSSYKFMIQELIVDWKSTARVPLDYKFYTFDGEIGFMVQIDRSHKPPQVAFYGDNFEPLAPDGNLSTSWNKIAEGTHEIPDCKEEMLDVVRRFSRHLRTPFVSLDMYASNRGPILGEITRTPGGPYFGRMWTFSPSFDRELGERWASALRRLGVVPEPYDVDLLQRLPPNHHHEIPALIDASQDTSQRQPRRNRQPQRQRGCS
jgi:hypothetical protein